MPYTLIWTTQARDKSARLWIDLWMSDAAAARRFSAAVDWIDQNLQSAPQSGQRRNADLFIRRDLVEVVYNYSQLDYSVTITGIDLIAPNTPTGNLIP